LFETYFNFKQLLSKRLGILSLNEALLYYGKQDFVVQTHRRDSSSVRERRYRVAVEGGFGVVDLIYPAQD